MIVKKRVIDLGGSKYLGLPREFKVEPGEKLMVIHNKLIGFALVKIAELDDVAFHAELQAVTQILIAAREVLKTEQSEERSKP